MSGWLELPISATTWKDQLETRDTIIDALMSASKIESEQVLVFCILVFDMLTANQSFINSKVQEVADTDFFSFFSESCELCYQTCFSHKPFPIQITKKNKYLASTSVQLHEIIYCLCLYFLFQTFSRQNLFSVFRASPFLRTYETWK